MSYMMLRLETPDFDTWKALFDADPAGRKQAAKGYVLYRGVDNPNEVIIQVEFSSTEQVKSFRERLVGSGVLDDPRAGKLPAPPIIVDKAEEVTY
ncbi:MAG: hypothetical protein JOZ09_16965 [Pseudonocardiales bacterium]|nr:hypothetical protein [Pseudonocardiales bacterium]